MNERASEQVSMRAREKEREISPHINATMPRTRGSTSEGKERSGLGETLKYSISKSFSFPRITLSICTRYIHAMYTGVSVIYTCI